MRRQWLFALIPLLSVACSSDPGVRVVPDATGTAHPSTTTSAPVGSEHPPTSDDGATSTGDGVGDELFPALGNPGIDVQHYDVQLAYDPATDVLAGTVGIDLRLTDDRSEITFDNVGPDIVGVEVEGAAATFGVEPEELRIELPTGAVHGDSLRVDITYSVVPQTIEAPGGVTSGWFHTTGGSYVLNEPDGARTWLPCNDHPSDKATYHFALTVPAGLTAVANGALVGHTTDASGEHWSWDEAQPMATYLVQVLTGDYEIVTDIGPHDLPLLSVVLAGDRAAMQPYLDTIGEQIAYFEEWFGRYPLDRYGIAMTDSSPGLAMEEQERSLFSRTDFLSGTLGRDEQFLLAHELAHQWFGDAVTPERWRDIWLNESFATYAEWMWLEHVGLTTVADEASEALRMRADRSAADPTAAELFDYNSYDGGAVVLHALRREVGDAVFFEILRAWVEQYAGTSVTTADFVKCAESVSGGSLTDFFATWLYADRLPGAFPA